MKLLSGLIIGFIVGVLATIGFLQMRTGELPSLSARPPAVEPAPATGGAPADTNPPASGGETGTPPKSQ